MAICMCAVLCGYVAYIVCLQCIMTYLNCICVMLYSHCVCCLVAFCRFSHLGRCCGIQLSARVLRDEMF